VPFTLCHFRAITGLPCPTCGMTTCFIHMTHGDFLQGAASSPLGVLVFLGTIAAIVFMIGHRIWKWPSIRLRMNRTERIVSTILLLLMLAANWAYNILHLAWHKI
jgi:phosphatidylserine synthase